MQKLILMTLVYVASSAVGDIIEQNCPENSVFTDCVSFCPVTCANMYSGKPPCAACKEGCECEHGYVLNENAECVLIADCDPNEIKCPPGQIYQTTKSVQKTCNGDDEPIQIVDDDNPGGCYCPENTVYDSYTGTCIQMDKCQFSKENYIKIPIQTQNCSKNAVSTSCASVCPTTCANMYSRRAVCMACMKGCACQDGYVLNNKTECVLIADCDPSEIECPPGQIYQTTKSVQKTCENDDEGVQVVDDSNPGGCYCSENTVFDSYTGTCIDPDQCQLSKENFNCMMNDYYSVFVECQSSSCIHTCDRPDSPCVTDDCVRGCFCREGFVKDTTTGRCVSLNACPSKEEVE